MTVEIVTPSKRLLHFALKPLIDSSLGWAQYHANLEKGAFEFWLGTDASGDFKLDRPQYWIGHADDVKGRPSADADYALVARILPDPEDLPYVDAMDLIDRSVNVENCGQDAEDYKLEDD